MTRLTTRLPILSHREYREYRLNRPSLTFTRRQLERSAEGSYTVSAPENAIDHDPVDVDSGDTQDDAAVVTKMNWTTVVDVSHQGQRHSGTWW